VFLWRISNHLSLAENTQATRATADAWLAQGSTALLAVPSAIVPETFNVLLNPAHPDAVRIIIVQATDQVIDPRLLARSHLPDAPTDARKGECSQPGWKSAGVMIVSRTTIGGDCTE